MCGVPASQAVYAAVVSLEGRLKVVLRRIQRYTSARCMSGTNRDSTALSVPSQRITECPAYSVNHALLMHPAGYLQ